MSDRRADMQATLNDIRSKPSTPAREAAMSRISAGIAKIDAYHRNIPTGGKPVRFSTFHDQERLKGIASDASRSDAVRERAKKLLDGDGRLTNNDIRFIG